MMLDHREIERIRKYHFSLSSVSVRYVSQQFTFEFHLVVACCTATGNVSHKVIPR